MRFGDRTVVESGERACTQHSLHALCDHDFIHKPRIAQASCTLSQSPRVYRTKLLAPESNGLIADHDASLGEEILDIPEAERESVVEP